MKAEKSQERTRIKTVVVVNVSLGEHGVIFDFRAHQSRAILRDDDQLGWKAVITKKSEKKRRQKNHPVNHKA